MSRIAFFVAGILLMVGAVVGIVSPNHFKALDREGINVQAKITQFEFRKSYGSRTSRVLRDARVEPVVHFTFRTAANETISARKVLRDEKYKQLKGQTQTMVRYLPSLPKVNEILAISKRRQPGKDNSIDVIVMWGLMFLAGAALTYFAWPTWLRAKPASPNPDQWTTADATPIRTVAASANPKGFGKRQK
jgi:hypothetical protein